MMKELANFHRIGFAYRFGSAEPTEMTMPITDDFQKIYRQALRVYDRFVRNAEELMKQERHEDARIVLLKAIPLNPKSNGGAKDLLKVCDQVLLSKRTGLLTIRANDAVGAGDMQSAFSAYMEVYALTADHGVLDLAHEIVKKAPALAEKEQAFIADQTKIMTDRLDMNDFTAVEKQLAILRPLVSPETYAQGTAALAGRKDLWVDKLVAEAMSHMQISDYTGAYAYFSEAHRLSGDAGIKDQMAIASDKYMSGRKFGVEDNIYADKLYYRMAYNLATDSPYEPIRGELNTFNTFYDQTDFKASLVALGKEAPETFPVR